MEGIRKSSRSHRTDVTMITHDKLSYLIISHPENGRKRNSIATSIQKSCLDNQCCSQWFPSRNTHNFAAAADSNSTWLFRRAKTSKTYPSWMSDFALFVPLITNGLEFAASPECWPPAARTAPSIGRIVYSKSKVLSRQHLSPPLYTFLVCCQTGIRKQ